MRDAENHLTDVAGLRIGHATRCDLLTGVTVMLAERPNRAAGFVAGGAPGSRSLSILASDTINDGVDAIVLSGGSAFGLDAAGGVMARLRREGVGFPVGSTRVPIVPQAITFDLLNGAGATWPDEEPIYWRLGFEAAGAGLASPSGAPPIGSVGAGLGATTATAKGGEGAASVRMVLAPEGPVYTVAALAVVNAIGSTTVGDGPAFWAAPFERDGEFGGCAWPMPMQQTALALRLKGGVPTATTIAIVATDAPLDHPGVQRMARMANAGLTAAIRPANAPMDGDTIFAVSVGAVPAAGPIGDSHALTLLGSAAADCMARAIARGVFEATNPGGAYAGPPAHRDRFPGR